MDRRIRRAKKRGLELGKKVPSGHFQRGTGPHKAYKEAAAVKVAAPKPKKQSKTKASKLPKVETKSKAEITPVEVTPKGEDISLATIADTKIDDVGPTTESGEPPDGNDPESDTINSQEGQE